MKGAMKPDDFLMNPKWLDFALMAESVEAEISDPKKGGGSGENVFRIINPDDPTN